jgi:hypothetical protein
VKFSGPWFFISLMLFCFSILVVGFHLALPHALLVRRKPFRPKIKRNEEMQEEIFACIDGIFLVGCTPGIWL